MNRWMLTIVGAAVLQAQPNPVPSPPPPPPPKGPYLNMDIQTNIEMAMQNKLNIDIQNKVDAAM